MSDPQPLSADEAVLARLLLRSAKLDVPPAHAEERALLRGLAGLRARRPIRGALLGAGFAAGLAAAAAFALVHRAGPPHAAAERIVSVGSARVASREPVSSAPSVPPTCPELVIARGDRPLIDDFEQDDSWVLAADGRRGSWITYDDGTGTQSPPSRSALFPARVPGGRGASKRALHVSGGRFSRWGVTFGTELADAACYDASAYAGIELWAKGPGELRVGLQMIDVQDVKYGGFCQSDCYDTHRKIIALGPGFKKYTVRWDELEQLFVAGPPVRFDPRRVRFLEFGIAPESTPFDVWIDDVSFLRR
jgi:hypothetical protein